MNDPITYLIYGAILFSAIQLCAIKYRLEDLQEQLNSIKIRLGQSGTDLPTDDDEEDSTDR